MSDTKQCPDCKGLPGLHPMNRCPLCRVKYSINTEFNTKQELREKIAELTHMQGCQSYTHGHNDGTAGKEANFDWFEKYEEDVADEILQLFTDTVKAEVNKALDELIESSIEEIPMSSGDNIPFVRVSAIEQVRKEINDASRS